MKVVVKTLQAAVLLALVSLLLVPGGWAQSEEQQSLGDIARKQKEKKGPEEEKGPKVLTNEDLPHSGGLSTAGSASGSASSSAGTTGTASGDAATQQGEKTPAAQGAEGSMTAAEKADEAKKELQSLQHDEASFEKGINHLQELMSNEQSDSRRELYSNALKRAQVNLADVQKKRAEAEKKAADAEAAAKEAQQNQPQEAPPQ